MTKKRTTPVTQPQEPVAPASQESDFLRRVTVRISEADYAAMTAHFAEEKSGLPVVTVHPPSTGKRELTDAQREKRKAYRNRPEVKDKIRAYRKERAVKLRALLAQAKAEQGPSEGEQ